MVLNGSFSRFLARSLALHLPRSQPLIIIFIQQNRVLQFITACVRACLFVCSGTKERISSRIDWREQHAQIWYSMPRLTFNLTFSSIRFDIIIVKRIVQIDSASFLHLASGSSKINQATPHLRLQLRLRLRLRFLYVLCELSNTNNEIAFSISTQLNALKCSHN